jgi:hypothetical protein
MRILSKGMPGKWAVRQQGGRRQKKRRKGRDIRRKAAFQLDNFAALKRLRVLPGTVPGEGKRLCWKILISIDVIPGLKML